jgi:hypothetical protein
MVPRPRVTMRLATSRPFRKPPKQAISQILKYFAGDSSRMLQGTLAPMLNTSTSIGPMVALDLLDQRNHLFFLARIGGEPMRHAAFGPDWFYAAVAACPCVRRVTQAT